MIGDIYLTKYMGKQLIHLGELNYDCHKTKHFKPKLIDASFRLHGETMVTNTQRYFCGMCGIP